MEKRTMYVEDIAIYLVLHKDTIYVLVKENKLLHIKISGRTFFGRFLESWMQ